MNPRERFWSALNGEMPDQIPLTIWNNKLPGSGIDEQLFALEVLLINKSSVWKQEYDCIDIDIQDKSASDGSTYRTVLYNTPAGVLTESQRLMPGTVWIEKYLFKSSDDYEALESLISSRTYLPDTERFYRDDQMLSNGKSMARPTSIHSPMHELIYEFMGLENFSIEILLNQDRLLQLHDVLAEDWLNRVEMVASSPARYAVIDGNTDIRVIGFERFEKYYIPFIGRACEILHSRGILAGAHLDSNNKKLAPLIARTSLDFIESFTPPPDCDMTITEAKAIWPDKTLLIHFPSSVHFFDENAIKKHGLKILKESKPGNRITIGTMEDIPDKGIYTLVPMYRFFKENGKLPIKI